jgi:BirA family biotin operon repressor/biotin-[acetyl-CoA-carboxylase] ligase
MRVARAGHVGHGGVIATTNQTAGRGRRDRTWSMAPGHGLALTLVLSRGAIGSPRHLTRLPLLVAVELRRLIESLSTAGTRPTVKWPNDVHIQGRKLAGILVEALDDDRLGIGIGVNLTGIPPEMPADSATFLAQHDIAISPAELVEALTEAIVRRAPDLDSDELLDELAATIDTIDREVRLELPDGRIVTGRATGIGATGSLCVDVAGVADEFTAADVTHLRLGGDEQR